MWHFGHNLRAHAAPEIRRLSRGEGETPHYSLRLATIDNLNADTAVVVSARPWFSATAARLATWAPAGLAEICCGGEVAVHVRPRSLMSALFHSPRDEPSSPTGSAVNERPTMAASSQVQPAASTGGRRWQRQRRQ